jgi:DNA-binding NtrC family response regulator
MREDIRIMICDDDEGIIDTLKVVFNNNGYYVDGVTSHVDLIKKLKTERFDILVLDYILDNILGDVVVKEIRKFSNIYIILLTGHKDIYPPMESFRKMDIQNYCEKSDKFEQITMQIESAINTMNLYNNLSTQGFAERLSMLRKMHNLSQDDLSEVTGIKRSTISEYEKGKYMPNTVTLLKFSRYFKVSVDFLLNNRF